MMDKDKLRKADFKTGVTLIWFCLWFLSVTFLFMPFKETYGGVENVWYVSPWIFPAVVLTLLLLLSLILTANAILRRGARDVVEFPDGTPGSFRLTPIGTFMMLVLVIGSAAGLWYLIINIEDKIRYTIDEAKWLADPSTAQIFSWSEPISVASLVCVGLVFFVSTVVLAISTARRRRQAAGSLLAGSEKGLDSSLISFGIITLLFCELVYVLVPNIDFFVCVLLFLTVFTAAFYVEGVNIIRASMGSYLAIGAVVLVVFLTGLDGLIDAGYPHLTDLVVLAATLAAMVWLWRQLAGEPQQQKKFRTCLLVSWATPLILLPVFRFGLLVPLPHEGAVIDLMHQIKYLLN